MSVPDSSLDIGVVWANKAFPWTMTVRNDSARDIAIESFSTTCSCGTVEPPSLVVPAGGEREIRLTVDLYIASSKAAEGASTVDFGVSPRIKGRARDEPAIWWKVKGRVRYPILLATSALEIGEHSEYAQPLRPAEMALRIDSEVRTIEARAGRSDIKAEVRRQSPERAILSLKFPPRLGIGRVRDGVALTPVLASGKRMPTITVPVAGAILSDVQATPRNVELGGLALSSTAKDTITLASLTGTAFSVIGAKADGAGLSVESAEGLTLAYRVQQEVKAVGGQVGRVVFTIQSGGAKKELAVPVRYHGIKAGKGDGS